MQVYGVCPQERAIFVNFSKEILNICDIRGHAITFGYAEFDILSRKKNGKCRNVLKVCGVVQKVAST